MSEFKYIHTKHIDAIANGDKEFLNELVDIFLSQIPEFVSNMTRLLAEKNWEMLAREAHTAKSSVLTFGMDDTGKLLKNIQLEAEANKLDELSKMVHSAVEQIEAAVPELQEFKRSLA